MGDTDWRQDTLHRIRTLIREVDPEVVEEAKWAKPSNPAGVPTWSRHGIICTGEMYKDKVKVTFMSGAALDDPAGLFNAGLDGGTRRAIDLTAGATLDESALRALIRSAVELNAERSASKRRS